ncbi:hypothetical protein MAM1_0152d06703 [Mucor ambiguus]|uniref:Uncharacterized protein n=1 Tax=Mucor ambiguus TaxID=91626 RepID=A0A0C9LVR0_9FUNG|nr:hypothetical protein MAM1_0152d06703 [Mucor ambiguus]
MPLLLPGDKLTRRDYEFISLCRRLANLARNVGDYIVLIPDAVPSAVVRRCCEADLITLIDGLKERLPSFLDGVSLALEEDSVDLSEINY